MMTFEEAAQAWARQVLKVEKLEAELLATREQLEKVLTELAKLKELQGSGV